MTTKSKLGIIRLSYILLLLISFCIMLLPNMRESFSSGYNSVNPDVPREFNLKLVAKGIKVISLLLVVWLGINALLKIYQFIGSVEKKQIFSIQNTKRLTRCGWNCIGMGLFLFLFYISKFIVYPSKNPTTIDLLQTAVSTAFWPTVLGLVLLTIGYVFKKGLELQQENELTV